MPRRCAALLALALALASCGAPSTPAPPPPTDAPRAAFLGLALGVPFSHALRPASEPRSLAPREVLPMQIVLLLRAGEEKLAHEVWTAWTAGLPQELIPEAPRIVRDPYPEIAQGWLSALHQRALWARERGDAAFAEVVGTSAAGQKSCRGSERRT